MSGRVRSIVSPALRDYLRTYEGITVVSDRQWDDDLQYVTLDVSYLANDMGFRDIVIEAGCPRFKSAYGGYDT